MQDDRTTGHEQDKPEDRGYDAFLTSLRTTVVKHDSGRKKKQEYWEKIENQVAFWALIAGGLYTIITGFIFVAQLSANAVSQNNLVFSNKAVVSMSEASWYVTPNGIEFIPRWENSGNVATVNAQSHINWHLEGPPVAKGFSRLDYQMSPSPLSIGAKSHSGMTYFTLPKVCFEDLVARRLNDLRVWGWITYHDGFTDINHTTRFCWIISGLAVNFQQIKSPALASYLLCDEGNCSDAECNDQPAPTELLPPLVTCVGNSPIIAPADHNAPPAQ